VATRRCALADAFPSAEWSFRLAAASLLEHIHTDLAVRSTLDLLPEETDAIAFGPLLGMSRENRIRLIDALNLAQYPTLSFGSGYIADHSLVNKSIYGNSDQIMRRLALNTEAILNGVNAGDLKVFIKMDRPIVINMEIAKLIGFSPEFTVLQKYNAINVDKISPDKVMNIEEVLYNVISGSLGLRSAELDFEQFSKEVGITRAQILPYLVANLNGAIKDPNQSSQTLGLDPQYQVTGTMDFSQLVYSELAFSQVRIQKTLRAAAELGFQEQTLDFVLEGMVQYLDILRAKADLQIQISNKDITSTNLKIAEQRLEVGQSGRSEVFRWESNLANANQAVVEARNRLEQQKIQLNASMNFPLDHEFDVADLSLESYPFIRYKTEGYYAYITNQAGLDKGIEFILMEAMENLPAYAQVEENVKAIEQRLSMFKRDRFIPDVSVNANLTGRLYRGGVGWDPNNPNFFTPAKYFWSVGATATLPIFQGNLTNTYVQQSRIALDLQENELARFEQDLEESIRQQVLQLITAKTNIDFTEDASVAANKALELTQDSYSEGTVSIVELIDAQNNALTSELAFINSEYNFLIEVLRLERLMGSFLLLRTPEENQEIVNKFLQFQPGEATNE
jgi:outer membrane protein TolC